MSPKIWALALALTATAFAGTADEDWKAVLALDAGPQTQAHSGADATAAILAHLAAQERALRTFVASHADDAHAFEARLRLARLFALRGEIQNDTKLRAESDRMLTALEKDATPEQRADLDFARLSQAMRRANSPTTMDRDALLTRARRFQSAHPEDRRLPQILAEIATLFDSQPTTKRKLLLEAQPLANDEETKSRIADDLRRLDLFGEVLALTGPSTDGKPIDLADHRGRVVVVAFFATWSPQSILALDRLKKTLTAFPKDRVQLIGVSLDSKPEPLGELLKSRAVTWPIIRDGKSWESPLIRGFGINTLPTVWLVDREGKLRALDALENTSGQIKQLLGSK